MSASAITKTLAFTHGGTLRGLEGIITTGKLSSTAALEARGDATFKFTDAERQHVAEDRYLFFDCPQNNGSLTYQGVKDANERGAGFQFVLVANGKSLVEQADLFGVSDGILMGRQDGVPLEIDVRKLDCKVLVPDCYKAHVDRMAELARMSGKELDTSKLVFRPIEEVRQMLQEGSRPADPIAAQQALCRELGISAEPTTRPINDAAGTVETKTSKVVVAHREEMLDRASAPVARAVPGTGAELVDHMRETPVYLNVQADLRELFGGRGARSSTPRVLELKNRPEDLAHAVNMLVRMSPQSTYHKTFHTGEAAPVGHPFLGYFELNEIKARMVRHGTDGQRVGELIDLANTGVLLDKDVCQRVMQPGERVAQAVASAAVSAESHEVPPLPPQSQVPESKTVLPQPAAAQVTEPVASSAQPAKATIRSYELPGAFELIAQGRESRFYDNGRQAGEAFYAVRREELPRVVQHYVDGFEDRTGKYENESARPIAVTAPGPDGTLQHIFLEESAEFRGGYEAARQRMPEKAVAAENWAQPGPQQQAEVLQTPAVEPPQVHASQSPTSAQLQQDGTTMNLTRLQINGVDVGRLAFEKHSTPQGVFIDLTALDRNDRRLAEFKGVDKNDLTKVLGTVVGHEVAKFNGRQGELVGQQLDVPTTAVAKEASAPAQKEQRMHGQENTSGAQPVKTVEILAASRVVGLPSRASAKDFTDSPGSRVDLAFDDGSGQINIRNLPLADLQRNLDALRPSVVTANLKFDNGQEAVEVHDVHIPTLRRIVEAARDQQHAHAGPVQAAPPQATQAPMEQGRATGRAEQVHRMEIDGKEVQRLSYIKMQTPKGLRYEVTAYGAGNKVLGKHPALSKEELVHRLVASPTKHLLRARGRNGSLRGDQLQLLAGEPRPAQTLSPEPKQGAKPVTVDESVQAGAAVPSPEAVPMSTSQEYSPLPERAASDPAPAKKTAPEANHEMPQPEPAAAPVVNSIERHDGPAQAPQSGASAPQQTAKNAAKQQKASGPQAAPAEPAATEQQKPVLGGQPIPSEDPGKLAAEKRRQELLASLAERFTINAGEYRFRSEQHRVAFVDRERTVTTDRNEPEVARAMVDLAEAKGWKTIELKGTEPFRAAAWMEASARGLKSVGYEPSRADLVRLQERVKDQQINRVALGQEPAAAHQTQGQQQARQPVRPTELSEEAKYSRQQALGVLEAYLKSQNTPPEKMAALLARGGKWLDEQAALGKGYPTAQVYDMNAQRQRQVHIQAQREQAAPARSR